MYTINGEHYTKEFCIILSIYSINTEVYLGALSSLCRFGSASLLTYYCCQYLQLLPPMSINFDFCDKKKIKVSGWYEVVDLTPNPPPTHTQWSQCPSPSPDAWEQVTEPSPALPSVLLKASPCSLLNPEWNIRHKLAHISKGALYRVTYSLSYCMWHCVAEKSSNPDVNVSQWSCGFVCVCVCV